MNVLQNLSHDIHIVQPAIMKTRQEIIDEITKEMVVYYGDTDLYNELPQKLADKTDEELMLMYKDYVDSVAER
jgi:hypothetical protein